MKVEVQSQGILYGIYGGQSGTDNEADFSLCTYVFPQPIVIPLIYNLRYVIGLASLFMI
jgi:hypothetical protein